MNKMGIIKAKGVVHEFFRRDEEGNVESITTALDHVDLDVKAGQFIAILGHNGSGKSTLAKHINALLTPNEGTLWVDGMDVLDEENTIPVRKTAGMVFQNPDNQIIASVVEEDVGFGPENIGVPTDEIWERVDKSLAAVEMTKYRKHSPNKLSGGQKQRVAIAGVVAMEPKCIIFDEPTVGLDPKQIIEIRNLIHDLGETHTVILSSHILSEVQTICDRVLIIAHGKVAAQGTPEELAAQLAARGMIAATALGTKEQILAAAAKVEGLTDLRVTAEKGEEVSFTATSTAGADLRAALSKALAEAGCPVVSLTSDTMSLEDIFLQITETAPEEAQPEETEEPAPEAAAAQPEQSAEPAEPQAPADDTPEQPETENDQKEEE